MKDIRDSSTELNFIPYEIAIKFKKCGFKEPCLRGFDKNGVLFYIKEAQYFNYNIGLDCSAPTYQSAKDWLKTKGIYIETIIDGIGEDNLVSEEHIGYRAFIWQIGKSKPFDDMGMSDEITMLNISFNCALELLNNK